jgi:potassium/sodium efflux P-type ATPase
LRVLAIAARPFDPESAIEQLRNDGKEEKELKSNLSDYDGATLDSRGLNSLPRSIIETDMTLLGLFGIYDPPRVETAGAVKSCHRAGITVHMVTGDHPQTAEAIAKEVGILPRNLEVDYSAASSNILVMTASQFDQLTDEQIDALPYLPLVIARCAPQTKVRMVDALHRRGLFVAMTGDGVNDSPALKRSDVGIGMGLNGSDVAKSASEIVLTDDNFASILNAIEEGRRMFDNIKKVKTRASLTCHRSLTRQSVRTSPSCTECRTSFDTPHWPCFQRL